LYSAGIDAVIDWQEWDSAAFARAARERKPVLLSITAAWCDACHEMDRTTYAAPEVDAIVRERFIPVRVDTDRRPDINERYNLGGWPTTAFLTPDGELMTGGTFVSAERMRGVLERVAAAFEERVGNPGSPIPDPGSPIPDPGSPIRNPSHEGSAIGDPGSRIGDPASNLIEQTFATFDPEHGGFGIEPKFPLTAPLHLALVLFEDTRDDRWRQIVERSLDAMAEGGLWDRDGGGFHRYATRRDWQLPHREKLLDTNASLLRVYANAARVLGRSADADRAAAIASFITTRLRAETGGYHSSDADSILLADGNAAAARALLATASLLDDKALTQEALDSFERAVLACYKPGAGVAHYFDGAARVRGLLADQIETVGALLDAHEITGGEPYKMMAEELGHFVVQGMWDPAGGGCFDRTRESDDVGLLRSGRKPFVGNAEAAAAFARLDAVTHEFDFAPYAIGALEAAGRGAAGQGPLTAHYLLAARQVR
jgi:uncharacterized protein YyaL (SSP411 family)